VKGQTQLFLGLIISDWVEAIAKLFEAHVRKIADLV